MHHWSWKTGKTFHRRLYYPGLLTKREPSLYCDSYQWREAVACLRDEDGGVFLAPPSCGGAGVGSAAGWGVVLIVTPKNKGETN